MDCQCYYNYYSNNQINLLQFNKAQFEWSHNKGMS